MGKGVPPEGVMVTGVVCAVCAWEMMLMLPVQAGTLKVTCEPTAFTPMAWAAKAPGVLGWMGFWQDAGACAGPTVWPSTKRGEPGGVQVLKATAEPPSHVAAGGGAGLSLPQASAPARRQLQRTMVVLRMSGSPGLAALGAYL